MNDRRLSEYARTYQDAHDLNNDAMMDALGMDARRYKRVMMGIEQWYWGEVVSLAKLTHRTLDELRAL